MAAAPLSADKIAVLAKWIDAGGRLPAARKHWAFVPPVRPALPPRPRSGIRSTPSFSRGSIAKDSNRRPRPTRDAAAPSQPRPDRPAADARRGRRVPRRQVARTPTTSRSTACSPRRITASAGRASGSTPPATPTPTASKKTSRASSGSIATGSSTPSTATCPTTSSSSSRSPATCCRMPRRTSMSPPASCATR